MRSIELEQSEWDPLFYNQILGLCVDHMYRFNKLHEHRLQQLKESGLKLQVHKGFWVLFAV
jgi:hypothetical protein